MPQLSDKIKSTSLFSDEEKGFILSVLPQMEEARQDELEAAIDDYHESITALTDKYRNSIQADLEKLASSDDPEDIALVEKTKQIFASYK